MTKPALKSLAGAAVLLLLSAHVASAGPDGTCEDYHAEETVASEASAPSTPVPTAADDTKISQIAVNSATINTSAKIDLADVAALGKTGDAEKKQTDSLPKE